MDIIIGIAAVLGIAIITIETGATIADWISLSPIPSWIKAIREEWRETDN